MTSKQYLDKIIEEIECEIKKNHTKANFGKKGCLRRLEELKSIIEKEESKASILSIYVLRNKETGKWFYEEYTEEFHGGSYDKCETDDLELLLRNSTRSYGTYKDLAESWCKTHSERYNLNLEVVEVQRVVQYKEVK